MSKVYVKPAMKYQKMVSEKSVANVCWGYHKDGSPLWWYDKNGTTSGFVHFRIKAGAKCGDLGDYLECYWYDGREDLAENGGHGDTDLVGPKDTRTDGAGVTVNPYQETYDFLMSIGGSQGQNFSGEGIIKDKIIEDS